MGKVNKGGREFFDRLPNLFFERFENTFQEYTRKWCTVETLPIIIAGHPPILQKSIFGGSFLSTSSFPTK
jgi:hypothetical protein